MNNPRYYFVIGFPITTKLAPENEMEATWLLFLIIIGTPNGTPFTSTIEFNSEATCTKAKVKIEAEISEAHKRSLQSWIKIVRLYPSLKNKKDIELSPTRLSMLVCVEK